MKIKYYAAFLSCLAMALLSFQAKAQTKPMLFDGTIVAGYVDKGAYINCTGPCIKLSRKTFSIAAGLLPSLRIKADKVPAGATKNSTLSPTLGFGLTAVFRHLAVQLPFYCNTKTATKNGEWNLGAGLGYKF